MPILAEGATTFSSVVEALDYSAITNNILIVISATAGFVVGLIAIRKGLSFLKRQIKGA